MLPKKFRGLKASEVSELFEKRNQSLSNRFYRVLWKKTSDPYSRFVVITTGKLHKSAVVRNRVRRVLYESVGLNFSKWTDGFRVAILVKNTAIESTNIQRKEMFDELMRRCGLFNT